MRELTRPATALHAAWLDARAEWGPGRHEDGFGLAPDDEVESAEGFATWVARLGRQARARYRWIVEDGRVLGGIALRAGPEDYVAWAGHVGYGVRPSARGRGVATWALREMLGEAPGLGLDRVLAVCFSGNTASIRTVERCGGVFEQVRGPVSRFWIGAG